MTVVEFIKEKNRIIYEETGLVLVPEDQIKECRQLTLDITVSDTSCPYCLAYSNNCDKCPMGKAGNVCDNYGSTWSRVTSAVEAGDMFITDWYHRLYLKW